MYFAKVQLPVLQRSAHTQLIDAGIADIGPLIEHLVCFVAVATAATHQQQRSAMSNWRRHLGRSVALCGVPLCWLSVHKP